MNLDWKVKLNFKDFLRKGLRKVRNHKNKDQIEKYNFC